MRLPRFSTATLAALASIVWIGLAPLSSQGEVVVLWEPSDDVSPYSFIPFLPRGAYHTMYTYELGLFSDGFTHDHQMFLRYELPEDLLGPGETIEEAWLLMVYAFSFSHWPDDFPPDNVPVTLEVREVLEDWNEDTLTWANMPPSTEPVSVISDMPYDAYGPMEFDVTETVRAWAHGETPNYGFNLTNPATRPVGFWTREAFEAFEASGSPLDEALRNMLVISVPEPATTAGLASGLGLLLLLARRRA